MESHPTLKRFNEDSLKRLQNSVPKALRQSPDPNLIDGSPIPTALLKQFDVAVKSKGSGIGGDPEENTQEAADEGPIKFGIPLEEIDEFYENTYIVVGQEKISSPPILYRFNAINKLYPLSPLNRVRLLATRIYTHWAYRLVLQLVIILNFLVLGILEVQGKQEPIPSLCFEIGFILIYSFELLVKILAKGTLSEPFTCGWSFWFWFDIFIIIFGITALVRENPYFQAVAALRLLKLVPITPCLRLGWNYLLNVFQTLLIVIAPIVIGLCCFVAVIGKQLYSGLLTAKCVLDYIGDEDGTPDTPESRRQFYNNSKNWLREENGNVNSPIILCGQSSRCPEGYICLFGYGPSYDNNYTKFDSFSWALLAIVRIVTQDFVEQVFQMIAIVLRPNHVGFFVLLFFVISLPFLSFVIGIIAKYFKEASQVEITEVEESSEEESQEVESSNSKQQQRKLFCDYICCDYVFCWRPSKSTQAKGQSIISRPIFEIFITTVLVIDIISLCLWDVNTFYLIVKFCKFVYLIEFILRYMAGGGFRGYIAQSGNTLAFIVLPAIITREILLELPIDSATVNNAVITWELLRVFRLAYKWNSLGLMFRIMYQSVRDYWYLFTFLLMYLCVFARVGMTVYGEAFLDLARNEDHPDEFDISKLPRWNFTDFMHSFMIMVRLLCGEWIETLWDCFDATSKQKNNNNNRNGTDNDIKILTGDCYLFYLFALVIGSFLTLSTAIAIVITTMKTLNYYKTHPENKRKIEIICQSICLPENKDNDERIEMEGQVGQQVEVEPSAETEEGGANPPRDSYWSRFTKMVKTFRSLKLYRVLVIILIILVSLCFIPASDKQNLQTYPKFFNVRSILVLIFNYWLICFEVPTKFIEFGCKGFYTNAGCIFDFILLLAILLSEIIMIQNLPLIVGLITFSRLFMLVDRIPRLKVVASALYTQVVWIQRFIFAGAYMWLIFALHGFLHYSYQIAKCETWSTHEDDIDLLKFIRTRSDCERSNFTWEYGLFSFNNVGRGLISLSTVAMFNGWIEVIYGIVDATGVDNQPIRDYAYGRIIYILAFILFGIFFAINIIFGVIVYNIEKKDKQLMFLTEEQKKSYQSKLDKFKENAFIIPGGAESGRNKPEEIPENSQIPEPTWKLNKLLYSFVTNIRFEKFILFVIFFDIFLAACEYYQQSADEEDLIMIGVCIVTTIYVLEMILKLFAWRCHYFKTRWNIFDLIVVIFAIIGLIFSDLIEAYFFSQSLLRAFRVLRLFRISNLDLVQRKSDTTFLTEAFSFPNTPEKVSIPPLQLENSEQNSKLNALFSKIYSFVSNFRFDAFIMVVILLDCFEIHFNYQYMNPAERIFVLILVPIIYYFELLLKLIAWRQNYFCSAWNIIDFLALIGITLRRIFGVGWTSENSYAIFDAFFLLETLRILRVLRFIPIWQYGAWQRNPISLIFNHTKLQVLRRTIGLSFPSLFNLFCFYCVVFFTYSLFGHILFRNVLLRGLLNDSTNFRTFWKSFFTLIQISMISGVDGAYRGISNTMDCSDEEENCGNPFYAKLYLITYVGLNTIIIFNMYLTLILETINQITVFDREIESVRVLADKRGELPKPITATVVTTTPKTLQSKLPSILKRFKFKSGDVNNVFVESSNVTATYTETKVFQQEGSNNTVVTTTATEEISLAPESDDKQDSQPEKSN